LRFFDSEDALQTSLDAFLAEHKTHLGLVSLEVPLISNLPVWSNIALIRQYHENMPWEEAKTLALDLLQRFGMAGIAEKRNPSLKMEELFCVMLIRAAMVRDAVVVLDRPFRIFPDLPDGRFFTDSLRKVDDLIAEAHIFDYNWEKERYGATDGAED
jgi:ABC-type transporter Mla maintaining outer membrane lipid asymmetry ATPase subunit MlaF